jgi:hypothetical protein
VHRRLRSSGRIAHVHPFGNGGLHYREVPFSCTRTGSSRRLLFAKVPGDVNDDRYEDRAPDIPIPFLFARPINKLTSTTTPLEGIQRTYFASDSLKETDETHVAPPSSIPHSRASAAESPGQNSTPNVTYTDVLRERSDAGPCYYYYYYFSKFTFHFGYFRVEH